MAMLASGMRDEERLPIVTYDHMAELPSAAFGARWGRSFHSLGVMAIQRNVQQQAADTRAKIKRAASIGATMPQWLRLPLESHALSPQGGLLVQYCLIEEQEGYLHSGIWLTDSLEFWEFEVMVSYGSQQTINVEEFTNATASHPVTARLPGTGPSFGHLACQVLRETRDA